MAPRNTRHAINSSQCVWVDAIWLATFASNYIYYNIYYILYRIYQVLYIPVYHMVCTRYTSHCKKALIYTEFIGVHNQSSHIMNLSPILIIK